MVALSTLMDTDLDRANTEDRRSLVRIAVASSQDADRVAVARAGAEALDANERERLAASLVPQRSDDKRTVFLGGFTLAGLLGLGFAGIALFAASGSHDSLAATLAAAALSLPSAIIGGLFGIANTRPAR